ncbi:DUF3761 domain-containing protein [Caballeronia sp. Lep1P3]|uniref:DUF3761 domain-containing protein n=1 Tax=Caballeronia sp. Lep1P3 TaxID=2878150 RepID=UPI001FD56528|nr:DUF3761 domain-containing protein [Caballeronia sp. Lep1P3]
MNTRFAIRAALRRFAISGVLAAGIVAGYAAPAHAYSHDAYRYQQPGESDLDNHGHYVNRDGNVVHSPAHARSGAVPEGASAQCRDGTFSFSRHHSGTCSRHGGVARWE